MGVVKARQSLQEPEYKKALTDAELLAYFWECKRESEQFFGEIWEENKSLHEMYFGETLSIKDKEHLRDTMRPPINFNYAKGTIDAILGADQADQKEATYRGEEAVDNVVGEWLTTLDRKVMQRCDGYPHESDAHFDQIMGGYGFAENFLDTAYYPMRLTTRRIQSWEALPDPDSVEDNGSDMTYFIRRRGWLLEEIQSRWPSKADDLNLKLRLGHIPTLSPATVGGTWVRGTSLNRRGKIEVYDFLYKRFVPKVVWIDPVTSEEKNTRVEELEARQKELDAEYEQAKAAYQAQVQEQQMAMLLGIAPTMGPMGSPGEEVAEGEPGMPEQSGGEMGEAQGMSTASPAPAPPPERKVITREHEYAGHCWYRAYILGSDAKPQKGLILEKLELKDVTECPTRMLTGYAYKIVTEGRVRRFGMMRILHDAQLYLNRTLQVYIDTLARGSKGGGDIEEGAIIGDPADFMKKRSTPGIWQIVAQGANTENKIKDRPVQSAPNGMENVFQLCIAAFSGMSGVTDWVKGTAQQERSNVLISNLQTQSMVMLNPLIAPLVRFRRDNSLCRMEMLLKFKSAGEIDKLLGAVDKKATKGILWNEQPNPQTGEIEEVPIMDAEGQPLTPGSFLKQLVNPFDFDVAVDVGLASPTTRERVWRIFEQGVLKSLLDAGQQSGVDMKPLMRVLFKNLPLPGTQSKEVGDEMEASIEQQAALEEQQGIVQAAINQGPEVAAQIVSQIIQAVNATPGAAAPENQPPS